MKKKEKALLIQLAQHQDRFMTSMELSKQLSLSERTIRTYVRFLQDAVHSQGAKIVSKQGFGYQLRRTHPMQFEMFLNKQRIQNFGTNETEVIFEGKEDRQNYILNKLLIENEHVFLETLADHLFVSRATLSKDMQVIKERLQSYSLQMVSKGKKGTWIVGKESCKRAFIIHYFFKGTWLYSIQEYMKHTSYFDDIPMENFISVMLEECRKNNIQLSDVMIQNVWMHIILSIKRMQKGLKLKRFEVSLSFMNRQEYKAAKHVIERLEQVFTMRFPQEEIAYLTLHLGAKNHHLYHDEEEIEQVQEQLHQILELMGKENKGVLEDDILLKKSLLEHLKPMLIRVRQGIKMDNPLKEEIMREHQDVFSFTKKYISQMPCLSTYFVSDDEWAYVTLHVMAAMERLQEQSKLQAVLICATGYGSVLLLKNRIEKEFGEYIRIVREMGYFELQEKTLQGIDVMISSVNLDAVVFGIPILHVSVFLSNKDKVAIRTFIDTTTLKKQPIERELKRSDVEKAHKEIFDSYVHKDYFQVFQNPIPRDHALKILIAKLGVQEKDSYIQHMVDQIQLREHMGSVVFSETIAIPHPAIPIGQTASIAVGIFPNGLKWDEDFTNLKFVFLLSPSCLGNSEITTMTKALVRFIETPQGQAEILACPTFQIFEKIFLSFM